MHVQFHHPLSEINIEISVNESCSKSASGMTLYVQTMKEGKGDKLKMQKL